MMFSQFACLCQFAQVTLDSEMCGFLVGTCGFFLACMLGPKSGTDCPVNEAGPSGLSWVEDIVIVSSQQLEARVDAVTGCL
jgi:hypothetical protein